RSSPARAPRHRPRAPPRRGRSTRARRRARSRRSDRRAQARGDSSTDDAIAIAACRARARAASWPRTSSGAKRDFLMDPRLVRELLERVQERDVSIDEALESLRQLPFRDIGVATIDHHRALRQGSPEVIFGERKTVDQIARIAEEMVRAGHNVLVT